MAAAKAFIDQNLERFMSKKLLVWLTTTGLLLADKVDSEQWVIIATAYVGTQGFVDVVGRFKGKVKLACICTRAPICPASMTCRSFSDFG